jgi:hypothetical protein
LTPAQAGSASPALEDAKSMASNVNALSIIELTFRGKALQASTGSTVNIPANAPHGFES